MSKVCAKCRESKALCDFPKDKKRKDGLHPYCRVCVCAASKAYYNTHLDAARAKRKEYDATHGAEKNARTAAWRKANPERYAEVRKKQREARYEEVRAQEKARRAANPERYREVARLAYIRNIDAERARGKRYSAENPAKCAARVSRRRAALKRATPGWEKELTSLVEQEAFLLSAMRQAATGIRWHVDHGVPLSGKQVTGLHVWNNFRVIPARLNQRKYNSFDENLLGPTMGATA